MMILVALALLAQDAPEEAFRKIEEKIEKAETLRVDFTLSSTAEVAKPGTGVFTQERGNRFSIEAELRGTASVQFLKVTCDGERVQSQLGPDKVTAPYDPRFGRGNLNAGFSRLGIFMGAAISHGLYSSARKAEGLSIDLKQIVQVINVQNAGDGKDGTKILSYEFKSAFQPMPILRARIWYDAKTLLLVKREADIRLKDLEGTIIETYERVEIDGKKVAAAEAPPKVPDAPITDETRAGFFIKAKLRVATEQLRDGKKEKAAETLQELIDTYPAHPLIGDARRLLDEAKKK